MIDHARSFKFDQLPDYDLLRLQIQETRTLAGLLDSAAIKWNVPAEASSNFLSEPRPLVSVETIPLRPGQIFAGYSARAGDPLFWRDPSLSPEKWDTAVCPAVVLWVGIDGRTLLQSIKVVCIGQGALSPADMNVVPISPSPTQGSLTTSPAWPLSDSYCYIFPWPMEFVFYPGEELYMPSLIQTRKVNLICLGPTGFFSLDNQQSRHRYAPPEI
ncbi:hypothetical protein BDR07DRAFT_1429024 [Suillus spraguei]|nr:hypothetical protein BDR07DRAFT_1429024 [Suillus spraguei]